MLCFDTLVLIFFSVDVIMVYSTSPVTWIQYNFTVWITNIRREHYHLKRKITYLLFRYFCKKKNVLYMNNRWRSSYHDWRVGISLTGSAPPPLCACPKPEMDFQRHMLMSFLFSVKMSCNCSFCWYWWNWWTSLFKLSFHNLTRRAHYIWYLCFINML